MIITARTNKSQPPRIVRFHVNDAATALATVKLQAQAGCMSPEAARDLLGQIERVRRTKKIRRG